MNECARFKLVLLAVFCSVAPASSFAQNPSAADAANRAAEAAQPQSDMPHKAKAPKAHKKKHAPTEPEADNEGDPSTNDLIAATIQAANAEAAMPPRTRVCTSADVAAHGRCQFIGQQYRIPFSCPPVPTDYRAWRAARVGDDVWTTSTAGRSWHLTKTSGKAKEAGQSFRVSHFAFDVRADNPCSR
jgi:hypothetical protein